MKIHNPLPNPNSKKQKRKAEEAAAHPVTFVECKTCGATFTTLYKVDDGYLCGYCKAEKVQVE